MNIKNLSKKEQKDLVNKSFPSEIFPSLLNPTKEELENVAKEEELDYDR